MTPAEMKINDMLNSLEEEDYKTAISFLEYLSASRKQKRAQKNTAILSEIQDMFADDKGWDSEQDMIEDMAKFRKEHMGF